MSKTVSAVMTLASLAVSAGTIAGDFRVSLVNAEGAVVASQDVNSTAVTFSSVDAGTYTVSAVRLDSTGAMIGSAVSSEPFTIPDEVAPATVSVDVPASVAVTLA